METVRVNKEKLTKFQKSHKSLRRQLFLSRLIILGLIITLFTSMSVNSQTRTKANEVPIIVGHGTMEQISENMYQIVDDGEEPIEFETIELPPMPKISEK